MELYEIIENVNNDVKSVLDSEAAALGARKVFYGPIIKQKLRGLPALWLVPDNLELKEEEMHMDLYEYTIALLCLQSAPRVLEDPAAGPKMLSSAAKKIRDGIRGDGASRAYIQHIKLQHVDYAGERVQDKNLFISSCQIRFLIRASP